MRKNYDNADLTETNSAFTPYTLRDIQELLGQVYPEASIIFTQKDVQQINEAIERDPRRQQHAESFVLYLFSAMVDLHLDFPGALREAIYDSNYEDRERSYKIANERWPVRGIHTY
jgi:hypothetical protein